MKKLLLIVLAIGCTCCTNRSLELKIEQLQIENETLQKELEKYKYAPDKLLGEIIACYESAEFEKIAPLVAQMRQYHPAAQELGKARELEEKAAKQMQAIRQKEIEAKEKAEKERLKAVEKLKSRFDDVSGITWYSNPYFTHYDNTNLCSLYIGQKDKTVWLRLKMSYYGESWIFFDSAYLSYEGNTYQIPFNEYEEKKTDSYTETWEWIDVGVDDTLLEFLQNAVNSDKMKMRLSGKYTKTRNLTLNERKALKDVLLAYDVLKNEAKKKE